MATEFAHKRIDIVFIFGYEKSPGEWATKRSVLKNIRSTVTAEEVGQVTEAFRGLSSLEIVGTERVHYEQVL